MNTTPPLHVPHRPKKRFGQHFLRSPHVLSHIISAIRPQAHEHFVEIGPGQGVLTALLLEQCAHIDVIEIDGDLVAHLKQRFANNARITIHHHDVLTFDFATLQSPLQSRRIVGNLPYNISSPIIFKLFNELPIIQDMYFMLQKEVALRIVAPVGNTDYNRLSVMTQYFCNNEFLFEVSPDAFSPPPKVYSAFLRMMPQIQHIIAQDNNLLSQIVKIAFIHRRKTLGNGLKRIIDREKLHMLKIDANIRPQELTVSDFVKITNFLHQQHGLQGEINNELQNDSICE